MIADYWGMETSPFVARYAPRFFVATLWYEEVAARTDHLLRRNAPLGILTGDAGSGRTWCVSAIRSELQGNGHTSASISLAGLEPDSLLPSILDALGVDGFASSTSGTSTTASTARQFTILNDRLAETAYFGRRALLVLEDADRAPTATLAQIPRLVGYDGVTPRYLTLLLTMRTSPEILTDDADPIGNADDVEYPHGAIHSSERTAALADLYEMATLTMELGAWNATILSGAFEQLMATVGCVRSPFTEDSLETLLRESGGNPRRLMRLADLSLAAAAASELRWVDSETIRWVVDQMMQPLPPSPPRRTSPIRHE